MKKNTGFTLIELMIVIAIIGILSTLAVPSYQDRIIKTQVKEGMQLAAFVKKEISDYYHAKKRLPQNNNAAGLPPSDKIVGNYVTSIQVADGTINITFGNRVNKYLSGKVLSIRPAVVKGYSKVPIAWVCGNANANEKMSLSGKNNTNIPVTHLPMDCRPG